MKITDVRIYKVNKGNLLGYVTITFDECFAVSDFRLCTGKNGDYVASPSRPDGKGGYRDTAYPVTKEMYKYIQDEVLKAYTLL